MGAYWGDGYGTVSREVRWAREAQATLPAAEEFSTIATLLNPRLGFPIEQDRDAWNKLLRTDEHTWGDEKPERWPNSERVVEQIEWKSDMARDAWLRSRWMLEQALEQLRTPLAIPYQTVAVFNPLSWERSGPVETELEPGETLIESSSKNLVPYAIMWSGAEFERVKFWASDVPALGYKIYEINRRAAIAPADKEASGTKRLAFDMPSSLPTQPIVIEGKYYRLRLDPHTGAIKSLYDMRLGRELVDPSSPFGLNEYLYVPGASRSMLAAGTTPSPSNLHVSPGTAKYIEIRRAPWGTCVVTKEAATETPSIESEIDIYDTTPRIDITDKVDKRPTFGKSAAYFAFPFAASHPEFSYPSVSGWFRPNEDQLPGAAKEWFLLQHAVRIHDGDADIVWASRDAAVATFQDIVRGTWPRHLAIKNGWIFSWIFNNYWYDWPQVQSGHFIFRYSITSAPAINVAAATRFGMGTREPLIPLLTRAEGNDIQAPFGSTGPVTMPKGGFVSLAPDNVVLLTLKPAEVGKGLIVRLQEIGGHETRARLSLPNVQVSGASLCNLLEQVQGPLTVSDGAVDVPLQAYGVATVKLEISGTGKLPAQRSAK